MMIKKTYLALCIVALNSVSSCFAGEMGAVEKRFDIYAPNLPKSNEITGGAVFLRPSGNADYAVLTLPFNSSVPTPSDQPHWKVRDINASFTPGFYLNGRHVFQDSGRDVNLNWTHLRTNDTNATTADNSRPPYFQMVGPASEIGPYDSRVRNAYGQMKYDYDVLNGDFGQHINIDPKLKTRIFLGISGLWLQEQLTTTFTGTGNLRFVSDYTSRFNGAGVRLGMDGMYPVYHHIEIVGGLAGGVLLGTQQTNSIYNGSSDFLASDGIAAGRQSISHRSYAQVVPSMDAKLAMKYSHQLSNNRSLSIEGGYMGAVYVDAIQNYVPSTFVASSPEIGHGGINSGAIFLQSLMKTTNTFSVNGPYVSASLKM